jgi:hypothetical protein
VVPPSGKKLTYVNIPAKKHGASSAHTIGKKTKICEQQITQEIMWDAMGLIFRAVLYLPIFSGNNIWKKLALFYFRSCNKSTYLIGIEFPVGISKGKL